MVIPLSVHSTHLNRKYNSLSITGNYLLVLGNLVVIACTYDIGPYGIVYLPWAVVSMLAALIIGEKKTMIIWFSYAIGWFLSCGVYFYTYAGDLEIGSKKFALLSIFSGLGLISINSALIGISIFVTRKSQNELQKSEDNLKFLLRNIVHDISNSLTLIHSGKTNIERHFQRIAQQGISLPKSGTKAINKGLKNTEDLVNQIKHIESIKAGKMQLDFEEKDLLAIIDSCVENISPLCEVKNIEIQLTNRTFDTKVYSNVVALKFSIIENLISNCVKFSDRNGRIDITVEDMQNYGVVTIRDYGVGMSKDKVESLFSSSTPTSTSGTLGELGTGFGMYIVDTYVKLLQVELQVESRLRTEHEQEMSGTSFKLLIPKKNYFQKQAELGDFLKVS